MTESLEDKLKRVAEEAWEGSAEKQKLLVNRQFRLDSVELVGFTDNKGNDAEAYVATVVIDGDGEERTFWLGGRLVMPQVKAMVEDDDLPVILTLIEDPDLKGSPYRLVPVGTNNTPAPAFHDAANLHRDTLVKFCQDNHLTRDDGAVNAAAVLEVLGVTADPMKSPSEAFTAYCAEVKVRKGLETADEAYKVILEELVMALAKKTPEPEEVPFE